MNLQLSLDINYELNYKNPVIGKQRNKINVYQDNLQDILIQELFCLLKTLKQLRKLVAKKNLDNASC